MTIPIPIHIPRIARFLRSNTVSIARDAGVLLAAAAVRVAVGHLALEHVRVGVDAVAVSLRDGDFAVDGLALGGRPGEVVAADFDVVVGEFLKN